MANAEIRILRRGSGAVSEVDLPILSGLTIPDGRLVGLDGDGNAVLANNGTDGLAVYESVGFCQDGGTGLGVGTDRILAFRGDTLEIGPYSGAAALTPGAEVYTGVQGLITQVAPAVAGQLVQVVGPAVRTDRYYLNINDDGTIVP